MINLLNKLLKFNKVILVLSLLSSIAFMIVIKKKAKMETDLDEYMPQEHPAFVYSNKAEKWFDIKDGIIIAIENKNGIYNEKTIRLVKKLTKKLQRMKKIKKKDVTSLYTADNIVGTEDGMDVKAFFRKIPSESQELKTFLIQLQKNVKTNEMIYERLVSKNEKVTIIIAEIEDDVFTQEFYHNILKTVKKFETSENKIYVAGRPIIEGTMAYLGPKDMKRMIPIVILVIILVLFLVLRSAKATFFTLLVVVFSTIWAFGLMAALNIPVYAVSTMIPVMLIAIGVADGIHLYSHLHLFRLKNPQTDKYEAVKDMIKNMWKPVMITSVTTAVGFISLLTSEVYPIKYFGIFTAFGVMAAMLFSLTLIPAGILFLGLPKMKEGKTEKELENEDNKDSFSARFTEKLLKYRYVSVIATALIIVLSIFGIQKVWINSSFLDKFEKNSDIVLTDKFINENFGGTSTVNVILDSTKKDAFKYPEVLKSVNRLEEDVKNKLAVVGNAFSLTDYIKRMNKVMNADKEEFNTIPNKKDLIAQYLLLYEMSGDPDNLWKVVNYDYKKANLTFQLKSDNSKAINSAIAVIKKHIPDLKKHGITVKYAGSGYKGLVFTDLILEGQIKSLFISLIIVIILLAMMLKNISAGFIGSVPIIITAVISFGLMGLLNIPLSTTTALLSSIAIGIGIDYAVHFIESYKNNIKKYGDKLEVSKHTMKHSGRAIVFNAIVVIAGFLVLLFSVFPPNRALGSLVSLNMFTSFVGTVTIMFLIMYKTNIFFNKE